MPPETAPSPTLTVTASTVQGWPDIEPNVHSFEAAAAAVGGEVIITDGSGLPAPPPGALGPDTTWLSEPGKSVFQLRLSAYRAARAPIIGVTEERVAGAVSVTYKRAALADIDEHAGMGAMDVLHQRRLVSSGAALIADDRIRVVHDQSLGFAGTVVIHYHAGRTFGGFRRQHRDLRHLVRILATPVVPVARFIRTARVVAAKGYGRELRRAAPAIWLLLVVQTAGQVVGFVSGPGDSPGKVQ